ncbi:hypothetical protein BGZ68_003894 [Mortierella alpina]|nr:hypothetical protein BGZ68_003894 [Mortierella alpina]
MTRKTIHSVIGIPELTECLSSYLTTSDVAHAMATCKAEVVIDSDGMQAGEGRVALCTNLRRIKAVLCRSPAAPEDAPWICFEPLLRNNNNLTHLHLEFHDFTPPSIKQAFAALSRLHHLTLTIYGRTLEESWFLLLLRASLSLLRLGELYFHFSIESRDYNFEGYSQDDFEGVDDVAEPGGELKAILEEAIAARTSETGSMDFTIKAFKFPYGDTINIVLPMLRSALVEIETLEMPELYYYWPAGFYEEVARKYCPRLRHLIIPPYYADEYPAAVCSFIQGAVGLKTVRGTRFTDAFGSASSTIVPTLIMHHSKTLEELELLDCRMIRSSDQQDVLASCKNLKRFWVVPDGSYRGEYASRFQDIVDREWGCLGLKELCLTLNRTIDDESAIAAMQRELSALRAQELSQERRQEERLMDGLDQQGVQEQERQVKSWAAKRVYMQIGRLVVLETLSLGTDESIYGRDEDRCVSEWDLTLSKGWLAQLADLKNLRHLHMRTNFWSRMGQAEVEFMDAEWLLLGDITFDMEKRELSELVEQSHWQWLHRKRTNLRLGALRL